MNSWASRGKVFFLSPSLGGKAVAQDVDAFTFVDLSFLFGQVVDSLGVVNRKRTALGIGKKPGLRAMLFPIRAQFCEQPLG